MCAFLAWLFALCASATAPLTPATWLETLPVGDPTTVPVGRAHVDVVASTPRGTMVLVERREAGFDTDHVWIRPDGSRTVFPDTRTHGVQDAAVSPDGRLFASGGLVVRIDDGTVVAETPERAEVLTGWSASGLRFWSGGRRWVWQPGERPRRERAGDRPPYRVTRELAVVDRYGRERGHLAGAPLTVEGPPPETTWLSGREVLVVLPGGVVRCDVVRLACERALR